MLLLLSILSLLSIITPALQIASCIKYETYLTTQYQIAPLDFSDSWFSHTLHFSPRKTTKIGLRSRRLFGCCDSGYQYVGFPSYSCLPFCFGGCQLDAHCTGPNQCTCDYGYHKNAEGDLCLSNETIASERFSEITTPPAVLIEITSARLSCNGSCPKNEICSIANDVCICQNGYERSNETFNCVPQCDNGCQNADCTSPNTCTCWPHYEKTNDSSCHLKCSELSCTFGECNQNGTCICAEGFFNNGTNCIWAADDIFSEPDDCECWSKFIWQKNVTESRCTHSCDDDEDNSKDCIPFKECQFYEGYIVCHAQMYKCIDLETLSTTAGIPYVADKITKETSRMPTGMVFLTAGLIILLSIVVVISLSVWNTRRNWLSRLFGYNTMENTQEEEEQV